MDVMLVTNPVMAKDGYKKGPWGTVTKIVFSNDGTILKKCEKYDEI